MGVIVVLPAAAARRPGASAAAASVLVAGVFSLQPFRGSASLVAAAVIATTATSAARSTKVNGEKENSRSVEGR